MVLTFLLCILPLRGFSFWALFLPAGSLPFPLLFVFKLLDIVDIKPVNMEELTEVITAAEFHPIHCNLFMYSSSKGTIKLSDMRERALCDTHSKRTS
jgi:hypothetical protein